MSKIDNLFGVKFETLSLEKQWAQLWPTLEANDIGIRRKRDKTFEASYIFRGKDYVFPGRSAMEATLLLLEKIGDKISILRETDERILKAEQYGAKSG